MAASSRQKLRNQWKQRVAQGEMERREKEAKVRELAVTVSVAITERSEIAAEADRRRMNAVAEVERWRTESVAAAEREAGEALVQMTGEYGLTLKAAVERTMLGDTLTEAEAKRLRRAVAAKEERGGGTAVLDLSPSR